MFALIQLLQKAQGSSPRLINRPHCTRQAFPREEKRERGERESKRDGRRSGVREKSKENEDMKEIDFSLTKFTRNGTGRGDVTASDN